jgi:2-oxoacid:acceptor oxidoreductase delta subunit (pyruvate/2-ketoisovalerate family)
MFGPIVSKSGSGVKYKTGSWRTTQKPKFLKKNCIACKMCIMICPEGCISGKEKNTFDCNFDYCKGCGNCVAICPKKDIIMEKE